MLLHFLCYFYWWKISICGQGRRLSVLLRGNGRIIYKNNSGKLPTLASIHKEKHNTHTVSQTLLIFYLSCIHTHIHTLIPISLTHPHTDTSVHTHRYTVELGNGKSISAICCIDDDNLFYQNKSLYCHSSLAHKVSNVTKKYLKVLFVHRCNGTSNSRLHSLID